MPRQISRDFPNVSGPGYLVLDTETTGMHHEARVIEIGMVFLSPTGRIEESFSTLLRGDGTVGNHWAQGAHRISSWQLNGAPSFRSFAPTLSRALRSRVPIVHNETFDLKRINYELALLGKPLIPRFGCTLRLGIDIGYGRMKLSRAIEEFGIAATNSHMAEDDALAAAKLFKYYLKNHRGFIEPHLNARGYSLPR